MSEENKNLTNAEAPKAKAEKSKKAKNNKSGGAFKSFLKSRKARHGSMAIVIVAVVIAIVIVVNIVCGLLVDRFPDLKFDFTANKSFALQEDTIDYVAHLKKDVTLSVLMPENEVENQGTYFIQAKNLLDKMVSNSNGRIELKYVDLTTNPTFTSKYPDVDWSGTSGNNYFMLVESGKQYKALKLEECFELEQKARADGSYSYTFTGTTIEQAVVTAVLNVTNDDKTVVNMITGNNEQDYSAIKTLLENNAYEVKEVSLLTQDIDDKAEFIILFAPSVDLDEKAVEKISKWLDNDGKYGRTLIYVPFADRIDTPNIDALLDQWGMQVNDGFVFETDTNRLIGNNYFTFITEYTDYYKENLKNAKIPVVVSDSRDIIIKDGELAHPLLTASDKSGVRPFDFDENWNYKDAITGETLNIAAEGVKTNNDNKSSRVAVFGSFVMFNEQVMSFNSYNNSAYLMNVVNTIADKDDIGITIESKSLKSAELGVTAVSTQNTMIAVFVFILPSAILVTGLVLWLRRRNK